jgi:peptidoglycan/xylan/chitin deacetylase (PgdA/CDA1 family)
MSRRLYHSGRTRERRRGQVTGPVDTYRQFRSVESPRERARTVLRDAAVTVLSAKQSVPRSNWIRFPYYHHVFDDQRAGFEAHLLWMKDVATPISLDDAVALLESDAPIDGRYFCVTFDDGYKNCVTNALPILAEHEVPAAFFISTAFVGAASEERHAALLGRIAAYDRSLTEFVDWDDCRQLVAAGMTIGSHTVSHPRLIELPAGEVEHELLASKQTIEHELGVECRHFSCPKGRPDLDFVADRDPPIASRAGYRSFLTTERGTVYQRQNPMLIRRDHVIASWPLHHLRYFFSR